MNDSALIKLLDCIGGIADAFLEEAETADLAQAKAVRRKRVVKYGAYSAAGVAVSVGAVAVFLRIRSNRRMAKSA